jgi:DHA2 family metal-tetracycline-proton antiporter-like MFS transporter
MILNLSVVIFMLSLDMFIVNISLTSIGKYFNVGAEVASWVYIAYLLVVASLLLLFGRLGDMWGYKRLYVVGLGIYGLGLLMSGLSESIGMLIAFSAVKGIGGAINTAIIYAMINEYFKVDVRSRVTGIVVAFAFLGVAIGNAVGGLILTHYSWRWLFFVNIPIAAAALVHTLFIFKAAHETSKETGFDFLGGLLTLLSFGSFIYALTMGKNIGWTSVTVVSLLVFSGVTGFLFVLTELRVRHPLLRLGLFRNLNFTYPALSNFLYTVILSGVFYIIPVYLNERKIAIQTAGFLIMVPSILMGIFQPIAGRLLTVLSHKAMFLIGTLLMFAAFVMFYFLRPDSGMAYILAALVVFSVSNGLYATPTVNIIMINAPKGQEGIFSSVIMLTARAGSVFGVSLFTTIFTNTLPAGEAARSGVSADVTMPAFRACFITGLAIAAIVVALAFLTKKPQPAQNRT